ncbi:hypothetical protein [Kitasatospora sp. NPDC015120]|uniref:hypothetical protein n=1 Tax=Kitasatospora sp. NPDC015120 TaxID=3364023 RepID=UPI0036F45D75
MVRQRLGSSLPAPTDRTGPLLVLKPRQRFREGTGLIVDATRAAGAGADDRPDPGFSRASVTGGSLGGSDGCAAG